MPDITRSLLMLLWKCFPEGARRRFSQKMMHLQSLAEVPIPTNHVEVYSHSKESDQLFAANRPRAFDPEQTQQKSSRFNASLIVTCKNESETIERWLDSLYEQSVYPSELVICDGGSDDGTVECIEQWIEKKRVDSSLSFAVNVFVLPDSNIAQGRNAAIREAREDILLVTDVGCELTPEWCARMLLPFADEPETEVVMGFYEAVYSSVLSEAVGYFVVPRLEAVDPDAFFPSTRSIAFRRESFEMVGGMPEFLTNWGEDSLFDYYLKSTVRNFAFVPDAIVKWYVPETVTGLFKMVRNYARGDAEAGKPFFGHYFWLMQHVGLFSFEILLFILSLAGFFAFPGISTVLPMMLFFMLAARRVVLIVSPYQPFAAEGNISTKLARLLASLLVVSAQAAGFLQGMLARKRVERAKMKEAIRGHIVVFSAVPISPWSEESEKEYARVKKILDDKWFVTILHHDIPLEHKPYMASLEHPKVETYFTDEFDVDLWARRQSQFESLPDRRKVREVWHEGPIDPEILAGLERLGFKEGRAIS